ncbi:helix-hairpin-helix domain-containing protein, partial [Fusobacterium necrophorum]
TDNEQKNGLSKININTASKEQLMTLPGVGSSRADEIIKYRSKNRFQSIEDIQNISGIGQKSFEKIKEKIIVD